MTNFDRKQMAEVIHRGIVEAVTRGDISIDVNSPGIEFEQALADYVISKLGTATNA